ncbi:MAG: arsenic metallochaperone ArsD family protein [Candidatus Helarchaeota archaeon]
MSKLYIYELDITGGTCGFPASVPGQAPVNIIRNELIRRNKITKDIKNQLNINIERIILKNISFLDNDLIKDLLKKEGIRAFPIFLLDGEIVHRGNFPDSKLIILKIKDKMK